MSQGHVLRQMAAICDLMPFFGFGFCDVISSKETHILLMRTKHIYVLIHVRRKGEVGTVQHDLDPHK